MVSIPALSPMAFTVHCGVGPIVRVGPREVHIKDPDYYDDIYASSGRRREKDPAVDSSAAPRASREALF